MGCSRASCSPILSQAMDTKNKSSVCTLLLKANTKLGSAQRRHHVHVISALPTGFLALRMSLRPPHSHSIASPILAVAHLLATARRTVVACAHRHTSLPPLALEDCRSASHHLDGIAVARLEGRESAKPSVSVICSQGSVVRCLYTGS